MFTRLGGPHQQPALQAHQATRVTESSPDFESGCDVQQNCTDTLFNPERVSVQRGAASFHVILLRSSVLDESELAAYLILAMNDFKLCSTRDSIEFVSRRRYHLQVEKMWIKNDDIDVYKKNT